MEYQSVSLEKRIKEHIRSYSFKNLFNIDELSAYLKTIADLTGMELLLTERHGEKVVSIGNFAGFYPDVVEEPGRKLRVVNRTVGHLYLNMDQVPEQDREKAGELVDETLKLLGRLGEDTYLNTEYSRYIAELEKEVEKKHYEAKYGEKEDILTGTYNKAYMEKRMGVIDRAEIFPVAVIEGNINDWKFVNDCFGDKQSDRLIKLIASILKEEAKPDYIIGRTEGDVFVILIPMAEEGEAEDYCRRVQDRCFSFNDSILEPSIAFGIVHKSNVEQKVEDLVSDAEYEMFQNKFEMKNMPGYQERLRKGLVE